MRVNIKYSKSDDTIESIDLEFSELKPMYKRGLGGKPVRTISFRKISDQSKDLVLNKLLIDNPSKIKIDGNTIDNIESILLVSNDFEPLTNVTKALSDESLNLEIDCAIA